MQASRQDFEKFAILIREFREDVKFYGFGDSTISDLASDLSDILEGSNSHFDRDKFLTACGL